MCSSDLLRMFPSHDRWAGVLAGNEGEDAIHNAGTNLKALFVMGNGITSTAQTKKVKGALDKLELAVFCDPFVNEGAIITDSKTMFIFYQQQLSLKQQVL